MKVRLPRKAMWSCEEARQRPAVSIPQLSLVGRDTEFFLLSNLWGLIDKFRGNQVEGLPPLKEGG